MGGGLRAPSPRRAQPTGSGQSVRWQKRGGQQGEGRAEEGTGRRGGVGAHATLSIGAPASTQLSTILTYEKKLCPSERRGVASSCRSTSLRSPPSFAARSQSGLGTLKLTGLRPHAKHAVTKRDGRAYTIGPHQLPHGVGALICLDRRREPLAYGRDLAERRLDEEAVGERVGLVRGARRVRRRESRLEAFGCT
eukprot:scaffold172901_cov26-Tisochrysis_lutea.AAC.1